MLDGKGTLVCSKTLGQLVFFLSRDIITLVLLGVTGITKVSGAPAEPLGDGTTELALELDKLVAVLLAVVLADAHRLSSAFAANQVLRLEVFLCLFVVLLTILPSSEIRLLALEAHVVG